jgi:3'-phosphoadenosine 5'-phosphosulfate sulfotransferase (PAPS reductase)/FAD synthetase
LGSGFLMKAVSELELFECPNRSVSDLLAEARSILDQPTAVYGMFSGGHDSLSAVHVASQHQLFRGAVHINTGIGVEQTREFVRETCRQNGWPLREMMTERIQDRYESLVMRFGFPGPGGHGVMYRRLKERCIRKLVAANKKATGGRSLLVAGMRLDESTRRMGNAEPHSREGFRCWCAPILRWKVDERNAVIDAMGWPKNPVVGKLCMSGECLCGAFAKPDEIVEVEFHFPETAKRIHELEAMAKKAGVHCMWGTPPPKKSKERADQPSLFSLCWGCGNKIEESVSQ